MISQHFYHASIRRYTSVIGSLFNGLSVQRTDSSDNTIKDIPVPLFFAQGQKYAIKAESGHSSLDLDNKIKTILPRMTFGLAALNYAADRQPNKNQVLHQNGATTFNRVPYDFIYEVNIKVKYTEDGLQIIEQIIPFFTPFINVKIKDNELLDNDTDIQINLESVQPNDQYEGSMETSRVLEWTLSFVVKGYVYKPVDSNPTLVEQVEVDISDYVLELDRIVERIVDTPHEETIPNTGALQFDPDYQQQNI